MRKIVALIIFLGFYLNTFSQNTVELIEKLKTELKSKPDHKKTASIYSDLTWYYSNISSDSALVYGKKAILESSALKDSVLLSQVYSDLGAVYFRKADYNSSQISYLKGYQIRKDLKDKVGMAKIAANLANIYNKQNNKTLALKSYLEAVDYFQKTNNFEAEALTNSNIGQLFLDLKNYKKSLYYTNKAIDYQKSNNKEDGLAMSYLTLGSIYLRMKDTLNALKYYDNSITFSKKSGNNAAWSSALNNISSIKINQNKKGEANLLLKKSDAIHTELNAVSDESSLKLNRVAEYISDNKYAEAKILLYKLKKQYSENAGSAAELSETYLYLSEVHSYFKAQDSMVFYIKAATQLQNQITENTIQKQTNELEIKYQTAKKEKLIAEQKAENRHKTLLNIIITIVALFTALFGFLIYRQQKLRNKQQQNEFQLKTAISQIETQNQLHEQRLSISRDLHDNIGAQLTFVISSIDNLKFGNKIIDNKITSQLTKISDFTKSTIIELRDTIWAMNSPEFTIDDFYSRLVNFIEKAKFFKDDITFKFHISEDLKDAKFSSAIGINLYRAIQEAINNAIKYSEAKNITVEVFKENNQIKIEIIDDGKGFDTETAALGNGIFNMKKRMQEVGGICEINSAVNEGTIITLLLPKTQIL